MDEMTEDDADHEHRYRPSPRGWECSICVRRQELAYGRCPYKTCGAVRDVITVEYKGRQVLQLICPGCGREQ